MEVHLARTEVLLVGAARDIGWRHGGQVAPVEFLEEGVLLKRSLSGMGRFITDGVGQVSR